MHDDELRDVIDNLRALGADDADVEAKRAEDRLPRSVRETLSAFSNTRGGVVILGLDEASGFHVTGVRDPAKMSADLAAMCSEDLEPPVRPRIKVHRLEGASLVVAEVAEIPKEQRPCYYAAAGLTKGSFVRVGDSDRRLSSYEVQLLLSNRGQPLDDEETVDEAGRAELDRELVDGFVARARHRRPRTFGQFDTEGVLRRARVLRDDHLTIAGLMALGRSPQSHFPRLMMSFVHYPTVDGPDALSGARFIDNVVAEGPIPVMVEDALLALRRNMSRRSTVRGVGRIDTWEYPESALREAIVNAAVHRDYSSQSRGTQIQIEMYPDRLVIRNPGGLYGSVREDTLGQEGISSARNATLLRLLEDTPIPGTDRTVCENRGSGIPTMLTMLRRSWMSPPRFSDKISTFSVTFPNHTLIADDVVSWIRELGHQGLTDSQCFGLSMLKNGELLDNHSYRTANNLDSRHATEELGDLVARGLIVQLGSRRWARYELAATSEAPPDRPLPRADRQDELLAALGDGEYTRAELAARTGLSNKIVTRWLPVLRRNGLVETTEENIRSPQVRYRRTGKRTLDENDQP